MIPMPPHKKDIPESPERPMPIRGGPPSPPWAEMKDELDSLKKSILALQERVGALESRVSRLEETSVVK